MTTAIDITMPQTRKRRNWAPLFLIAPAAILLLLIFAAPFVNGIVTTFRGSNFGILDDKFTLSSWSYILTSPAYLQTLIRTLLFAGLATILCLLIGFPVAYHIVFRSKRSGLLTLFVIVPLLLNSVVLGIGWIIILNSSGFINSIYQGITGSKHPLELLYTPGAVIIGMMFVYMPYMIISLISALRSLDMRVVQSAVSLGASPARAFWDVTVPLSMPGILSGLVLTFALSGGVFIIPVFLGGSRLGTLSLLAYDQATASLDFPLAIATAFVLLVVLAAVTSLITRIIEGGRYKEVFNRAQV